MRVTIRPGSVIEGASRVPGDKSIAHRHLILASTAKGRSEIRGLPAALDVLATARCLSRLVPSTRASLEAWASKAAAGADDHGFTWDPGVETSTETILWLEGEGRTALAGVRDPLDCGNSGTSLRLLCGVVAGVPIEVTLSGDESLRARPMERVAAPLRAMGAHVSTSNGHAPVRVRGGALQGIEHASEVPSAQVKGCVLLAGVSAEGRTVVRERVTTRDHTERALAALGAPIEIESGEVSVRAFQHEGFATSVPGDVSSAAFLVAAAAVTGGRVTIGDVGLNPSRTRYLDVMERMGIHVERRVMGEVLGEPVGELEVAAPPRIVGTTIGAEELPLIIDEVPVLALVAAHAAGESRFQGAGELRVKESDRLMGLVQGIMRLGGQAAREGEALVVAGGGLAGGLANARGDHRMAMSFCVGAFAASRRCVIEGVESASVSFPGFVPALRRLGGRLEE